MCQNLISTSPLGEIGMVILGGAWGSQKCWTLMMSGGGILVMSTRPRTHFNKEQEAACVPYIVYVLWSQPGPGCVS